MPEIILPTLHQGQIDIWNNRGRLNVVRCGRRWGKTKMMVTIAADTGAKGRNAGLFTPEYKQLLEPYDEILDILTPIKKSASRQDGRVRTTTKGKIDFWAVNDNQLAGRGREYHINLLDEAAFTKNNFRETWDKAIKPTLLTTRGSAWVFSTPNGMDPDNFFYQCCHDEKLEFVEHHAPTSSNPFVPADELEKERRMNHPLVFKQEFLAEFVDWSGVAFFGLDKMLHEDRPVPYPHICDTVYAVLDTAVKSGKEHDGTAVLYCASSQYVGHPLVILDYDKIQIDGAMLETWLPTVYQRLEELAVLCKARYGSQGVYIEDKASGSILIQQAQRHGWEAQAIDSKLTSVGKDERAISVSGYVYQGKVKLSQHAFDKQIQFKGVTRNHLLTEVMGFRLGDKKAYNRADDLLDVFCYAIALALGNHEGY